MLLTAVKKQRLLITSRARDGEGAPSIDGEMSKLGEGEVASASWWIACWLQRRVAVPAAAAVDARVHASVQVV
eukprot:scaffold3296_cov112-Cylindrotheca_fusiformis.AAC.1